MNRCGPQRSWNDDQLADAVKVSTNWRAVMRELGLKSTSAGTSRTVHRRARELGLDTSHFRGARRWSDAQLRDALSNARTWDEVLQKLGLSTASGSIRPFLKSHAIRLGLDCSHLLPGARATLVAPEPSAVPPDLRNLRKAASSIAATWFALCGCAVAFPIEPAVFDLLVSVPDGIKRVQVKTTTYYGKDGWAVGVGRRPYMTKDVGPLAPYDPYEIDCFFIIDGDFCMYLIPSKAVAGTVRVLLHAYRSYIIGSAAGLIAVGA